MSVVALWAPLEVPDFDAAAAFYGELLNLPRIDAWDRDGERGAVFGVGISGRIEIVQTGSPTRPPAIAVELPSRAAVDALQAAMSQQLLKSCDTGGMQAASAYVSADVEASAASVTDTGGVTRDGVRASRDVGATLQELPQRARVFPRGHYGFVARDPGGNGVLIWTEARACRRFIAQSVHA